MDFDLNRTVAVLERTPAALAALLRGLPAGWIRACDGGASWSPFDIVGHLIHGERTDWIPRALAVLSDDPPGERRFAPFDRFAQERESAGKELSELLDTFAELRAANLDTLAGLGITGGMLDRTGVHPEFGEVTLRQLLATWAAHDLGHVAQAARVMAREYRGAVGPWRAYLPVMDR